MNKPNLLFPTPVWTTQLENFESINNEMYSFIKDSQIKDQEGIKNISKKVVELRKMKYLEQRDVTT